MLTTDHIFSIKTKEESNVAEVRNGGNGIVITGLNVLREQIQVGDFVFVVFGGDKPKGWSPGLVALAHISREPYSTGEDVGKNFRVEIDVDVYFQPSIVRADLVTYPDTFGTIGIGPITKWEPNQAITSVFRRNAIGLLQAICDLRPEKTLDIKQLLGDDFSLIDRPVRRYVESQSQLGKPNEFFTFEKANLQKEYEQWLADGRTSAKTAHDNAVSYIPSIDDNLADPTKHIWHGLREALYGARAPVRIYAVKSYAELLSNFGGLDLIFDTGTEPLGFSPENYKKCYEWAHDLVNSGCVRAAWRWYKKFIQWKESQGDGRESVDRFTIALKLFQEQRGTWRSRLDKMKAPTYQLVNADVRSFFGKKENWDVEKLKRSEGLKDFCLNHTWMLCNGKGSWVQISGYDDAERAKLVEWIDKRIVKGEAALQDVIVDDNGLKGFTNKAASELLMKFHPESYILCNGPTVETLRFLRSEWDFDENYSYNEYLKILGVAATIRDRMADLGIRATIDGKAPPDFIAVNEFIFFVSENKALIKEKVMAKEFKKVTRKPKMDGKKKLSDMMKDDLLKRLAAALRTKPFAILAGHSGTGKSQMVRRLAYMTCADEGLMAEAKEKNAPGNYCMIQVRPNWHDSTDLLGYYSEMSGKFRSTPFVNFVAKAYAYPEIPFFVCLDEMNLAPVEQYFAEYLSAVESASDKSGQRLTDPLVPKTYAADEVIDDAEVRFNESKAWYEAHGLTLPKNLFVVGTVNMDDTTCQFSRKVLDRAMTIMMDKVAFEDMMDASKSVEPSEDDLLEPGDIAQFLGGELRAQPLDVNQVNLLKAVDRVLGKTPFAVAYRFANEYALYEASLIALTGVGKSEETSKTALDHCVLMKVLPRIHGERKEMELLFRGKTDSVDTGLEGVLDKATTLSGKKMEEILDRKSGYLSFWP